MNIEQIYSFPCGFCDATGKSFSQHNTECRACRGTGSTSIERIKDLFGPDVWKEFVADAVAKDPQDRSTLEHAAIKLEAD